LQKIEDNIAMHYYISGSSFKTAKEYMAYRYTVLVNSKPKKPWVF
jgi:hypothetical protein